MPTFARIRFRLPRDRRLNAAVKTFPIASTGLPNAFELVGLEKDSITESANLVLRSTALESNDDVETLGKRMMIAILIASARIRLGVDLGREGPSGAFFPAGLEMVRQMHGLSEEAVILNDHLGLTLVEASRETRFAGFGDVHAIVGTPAERFAESLSEGYRLAPVVTKRSGLALELLAAARFESSLRARFLTVISAIECIVDRPARSTSALALLARWKEEATADCADDADRTQLVSAFRDLERRSIASSCKRLVDEHCGEADARLFGQAYKGRSEMVHTGRTDFDLGTHIQTVETIASTTVVGSIAAVA